MRSPKSGGVGSVDVRKLQLRLRGLLEEAKTIRRAIQVLKARQQRSVSSPRNGPTRPRGRNGRNGGQVH